MITGAIAVVFIIAMIAAGNNGEWGSVAVGSVIVVLLLMLGAAGREESRAYNNMVHFWATGEGPCEDRIRRTRRAKVIRVSRRERKAAAERRRKYIEERKRINEDPSCVDGMKPSGELIKTCGTTQKCPMCNVAADEFKRVQYSSGSVFVNCRCRRCGRTWPVKIK